MWFDVKNEKKRKWSKYCFGTLCPLKINLDQYGDGDKFGASHYNTVKVMMFRYHYRPSPNVPVTCVTSVTDRYKVSFEHIF